jgi:L-ascorbate metabolism protein UlaG (beta-lactamase superfamily)
VADGLFHVGNSTHLIELGGVRVLTDPWVSEPADHVLGHRIPPAPLPTDPALVLITHQHGDHLDPAALALIDRRATVVCPPCNGVDRVQALGFAQVRLVNPGEVFELCGLTIAVVRGRHSVPEVCFRLSLPGAPQHAVFFGGDTMRTPEIDELACAHPTPFVILPGERSSLLGRRYVMTPPESVELAELFRAEVAVLSHHESRVIRRWPFGWMVKIPPPDPHELPAWFQIPTPGTHIAFPWTERR